MDDEKIPSFRHAAHDLNNIFTRILNNIEVLKRKSAVTDEAVSLLNNIESGTYLASEIIEETLAFPEKRENFRRIKINSLIRDIIHTTQFSLQGRIKFEERLNPELSLVEGRYTDFYRIILNLVTNAIDAISDSGRILFVTDNCIDYPNMIFIQICDSGSGIGGEKKEVIFQDRFTTKGEGTGRGVGLTIVSELVDKYNGRIEVESSLESGTTFTLYFPAIISPDKLSENKSILIAEDETIVRELLCELLESYGYKTASAKDGLEALHQLKTNRYDLLIIDKKMPNLDGLQFINILEREGFDIPVILVSGSPYPGNLPGGTAKKVINKPYNFDEMVSMIRELIG